MSRILLVLVLVLTATACGPGDSDGPVLSTGERLALAPSTENGQRLFLECAVCHERSEGTGHRVGPNLWGVVGAPSAHHDDFAYSAAMKRAELTWTAETLDAYIANPRAVVPGGRMAYPGMTDPADRRDLVAYLETLQ